jgi:hypothetical protein
MIALLVLQGCAGVSSVVEFEVLEPATVNFPDHVNQLVILNRAPLNIAIWAEQNRPGMDARQLILLDTMIVNNLNRGVLNVLRHSPIERFYRPIWLSDRRVDTISIKDFALTKREVVNICDTIGGDAIISLEYYTAAIDQHFDYYADAPEEIQNHYFEVSNSVTWNIYLPGNPRPYDSYSTVDTLFFSTISNGVYQSFSPSVDMLREIFYKSGDKYGSYLVPIWSKTSRMLYRGEEDSLKLAVQYTDQGDWEGAASIWGHLTQSDDSTLVAKAYHNMAVYFELEDKLDSASLMLDLSLEHDTLDRDRLYRDELDVRLLNRKDIERQVHIDESPEEML